MKLTAGLNELVSSIFDIQTIKRKLDPDSVAPPGEDRGKNINKNRCLADLTTAGGSV